MSYDFQQFAHMERQVRSGKRVVIALFIAMALLAIVMLLWTLSTHDQPLANARLVGAFVRLILTGVLGVWALRGAQEARWIAAGLCAFFGFLAITDGLTGSGHWLATLSGCVSLIVAAGLVFSRDVRAFFAMPREREIDPDPD